MTVGNPRGFPTPSYRNSSAKVDPGACRTSRSKFDDVASDSASQPFRTTVSSVLRHHSMIEA